MRNEAVFLLEWIAYQLVIGFGQVVIVTNECTDKTDRMVARLSRFDDRIVHIRNEVADGQAAQVVGMRLALAHSAVAALHYVLDCDADEFLHVAVGAWQIPDLIARMGNADCIALAWRPFGDAAKQMWDRGFVLEPCPVCDAKLRSHTVQHKSIFRPSRFGSAIDHWPKNPVADDIILVNIKGDLMIPEALFANHRARFTGNGMSVMTWQNTDIHHRVIKSRDVFLMKNVRGDGMALNLCEFRVRAALSPQSGRGAGSKATPICNRMDRAGNTGAQQSAALGR